MFLPRTFKGHNDYYYYYYYYLVSLVEVAGVYLVVRAYYKDEHCGEHITDDSDLKTEIWEFFDQEEVENFYEGFINRMK